MTEPLGVARLFAKYGPFRGLDLAVGNQVTIGRGSSNDVVLSDPAISHRHARIEFDRELGQYVLIDEGSSNGTQLDGMPLRGKTPLGEVAVIGIGGVGELIFSGPSAPPRLSGRPGFGTADRATTDVPDDGTLEEGPEFLAEALARIQNRGDASPDSTMIDFEAPVLPGALGGGESAIGEANEEPSPAATSPAGEQPSAASAPALRSTTGTWALLVRAGDLEQRFVLTRGSHIIGRGSGAEIRIDHPHLSRSHARIDVGDTVAVEDLGSSNRTFVEGREIGHRTELEAGAHLAFGDVRAELVLQQ